MRELLETADLKVVRMLLGASVLLLGALLFSYLLWPQVKSYQTSVATRVQLQQMVRDGGRLEERLEAERQNVAELSRRLQGDMAELPLEQMESYIIGRLQKTSWQTGMELISVQPTRGERLDVFRELLFEVEVAGTYFDFFDWLKNLSRELGFMVVKKYEMSQKNGRRQESQIKVQLMIASYRMEE